MQKFFKLSAERMRIICGVAESRIFRVTGIETNMIGGAGFDAFVTLDSGDGWYKGAYMGKLEMFAARGEFVTEAEYLAQDAAPVVVPACAPGEPLAVMALAGRINRECLDWLEIPDTDGELMLVAMPHGVVTMFTDMNGYATPEECYSAAPHAHRIVTPSWNAYVVDLTKRAAPECVAFLADVPQESNAAIMARAVAFVRDIRLTAEYLAAHDDEPAALDDGITGNEQVRALAHEHARADAARKLSGVPSPTEKGMRAHAAGKSASLDNPYAFPSPFWYQWEQGFALARRRAEQVKA